jgi:phosphoglycolate phosphatase-like HAD superfamily hydrolase
MTFLGAILWDLDGTLLTTAKAGRLALQAAVAELAGVPEPDFTDLQTSGLTDSEVAAEALRAVGVEAEPELVARVSADYERRLPDALLLREGSVLPGIREALDGVAARGRLVNLLLTGNTEGGARAKLARYGIADRFPHGGAFCEGDRGRVPIARRALALAASLVGEPAVERTILVGDTPLDVACATAVGVRSLALATGAHSPDELREAGAWHVLERVPAPEQLEALVLGA